jgi:hypothetical protein
MLTLLGSLLGFGTSFLPNVLDFFKEKQAHSQKLEMLKMQAELNVKAADLQINILDKQAEIAETKGLYEHDKNLKGGAFIDALRSSVRPVITYFFFGLFVAVKVTGLMVLLDTGSSVNEALNAIWDPETQSLFAAVLAFWFGSRTISKFQKK